MNQRPFHPAAIAAGLALLVVLAGVFWWQRRQADSFIAGHSVDGRPIHCTVHGDGPRVVLLMAHLEQAWIEAKHTGDDDVRRDAKAPRRRVDRARALVDKLSGCAESNGASFSQTAVWRRIEREVPQRQSQIALPE